MSNIGRNTSLVFGVALAALAAGCATNTRHARVATYGAPATVGGSNYTGADRIFRNGYVETLRPGALDATEAQILASYEGIDGARLAHRLYGEARAEQLDGACEPYVKIVRSETLYDIAQYCDVPVSMLMDYNPLVRNARHVETGEIVEVPQIFNPERHALAYRGAAGVQPASWYVVQPGDTLTDIAARHLVSTGSIAALNPYVDVERLAVGVQLRIPATGGHDGAAAPLIAGALPYPYGPASAYGGSGDGVYAAAVTGVMPYASTPAHSTADDAVPKSLRLAVDRKTVKPGGDVVVSAAGLPPLSAVSLYRGPNGADLEFVGTVMTDSEGRFSEPVTVKSSSDIGGVIFRATIEASGSQLQSPRVGVDRIEAAE